MTKFFRISGDGAQELLGFSVGRRELRVRVLIADREVGPWYGKSVALFITNGTARSIVIDLAAFRATGVIVDGDLGLQGVEDQLECVLTL
jgi:hypothetical protein